MAVEFERLVVYMDARLADYEKALAKARGQTNKQLTDMEKRFQQASGKIAGFGKNLLGALGVGVGLAGITAAITAAARLADELEDTSKQVGVTTDQLQALRFAAAEAGIGVGELDSALDAFARKLGDAASGEKNAVAMFEQLGVAIKDASGNARSMPAVMEDVARAISGVGDRQQQLAALADLFGRSGVRLLPVLDQLAGGFENLTQAASDAGQVMSEETIKALAEAEREIEKLKNKIIIWVGEIAAAINRLIQGPQTLAEVDEALANLAASAKTFETTNAFALPGKILSAENQEALKTLRQQMLDTLRLRRELGNAPLVTSTTYQSPGGTGGGGGAKGPSAEERAEAKRLETLILLRDEIALNHQLIASYGAGEQALEAMRAAQDALNDARKQGFVEGTSEGDEFFASRAQLLLQQQQLDMLQEGAELTRAVRTEEEERAETIARLNELRAAGVITEETYSRALEETNLRLSEMRDLAEAATGALISGIISAAQNGEGLKGVLDAITQSLTNIANQLANKALEKLFGLAFDYLFGAAIGGGSSASLPIGGIHGSMVPKMAGGGQVQAGSAYVVGERRAELFIPSMPGRIEPNTRGTGGGLAPLVQVINNVPDTVHREERSQENGRETLRIFLDQATAKNIARSGTATRRTLEAGAGFRPHMARR